MKKKLAAGILTASLLVGGATTAFGATDSTALTDIKALYQNIFVTQKQILEKQVEAGAVTQDQANAIQGTMDLRQKYQEQALDSGLTMGPGMGGMGGMGRHGYLGTAGQALTEDQQKALNDYMAQRLKLQQDALANGTLVPGMGMGGYGRWGGNVPSTVPAPATSTN